MRFVHAAVVPSLLTAFAPLAFAGTPVVDGRLDSDYGAPIVTQTTQTQADDTSGFVDGSNGWELDQAYGVVRGGVLYLMLTGNILLAPNQIQPGTLTNAVHIFIDSAPGGQNTVVSPSPGYSPLTDLAGLRFDPEFAPDHWIGFFGGGGPDFGIPYNLQTYDAVLPTTGADVLSYLGMVSPVDSGTLANGSNPNDIRLALDNSNPAGVGEGCAATSGAGATSGIELAIPLSAIGGPAGSIRVCAIVAFRSSWLTNQVLGPVPPGTCNLGGPSGVDFANVPGFQYFEVSQETVSQGTPPAPGLELRITPNRSSGLTVRFSLPSTAPARLDVVDAGGRRVLERGITNSAGSHTLSLAPSGTLAAGVYFVRLAQGARSVVARGVVIP